jgi:hypothetical protein
MNGISPERAALFNGTAGELRPFRACFFSWFILTQGVALGYRVEAFQAHKSNNDSKVSVKLRNGGCLVNLPRLFRPFRLLLT